MVDQSKFQSNIFIMINGVRIAFIHSSTSQATYFQLELQCFSAQVYSVCGGSHVLPYVHVAFHCVLQLPVTCMLAGLVTVNCH